MNSCLQVKVTKAASIKSSVNQICQIAVLNYTPLLVNEGYLLVDVNGQLAYIYVYKNKDDAKRILS